MKKPKRIKARDMDRLKTAIYKAEGWTKEVGEVRAKRIKPLYDITVDWVSGFVIAKRKE